MQRNAEKCSKMQRNAEKCREIKINTDKCMTCMTVMTFMTHGNVIFDAGCCGYVIDQYKHWSS